MAMIYWRGSGTGAAPGDGLYSQGSNWSGGTTPGESDQVYFADGSYTVTSQETRYLDSATIGTGVIWNFSFSTFAYFYFLGPTVNYGTMALNNSGLAITGSSTLLNFGRIYGATSAGPPVLAGDGLLLNLGLIGGATVGRVDLAVLVAVKNEAGGVIQASGNGVFLVGMIDNDGLISATGGGTVSTTGFARVGTLANLSGGVLSRGEWFAGSTSNILLSGTQSVSTLSRGADVTLDGAGSAFATRVSDATISIESSLETIERDSALHVTGGRDFTATQILRIDGKLELGGGTLTADLRVNESGTLIGFGTVTGEARIDGRVAVGGPGPYPTLTFVGDVEVNGVLGGRGTAAFEGGQVRTRSDSRIAGGGFVIHDGTLIIEQRQSFAGIFVATDATIELRSTSFTLKGDADFIRTTVSGRPETLLAVSDKVLLEDATFDLLVRNNGTITVAGDTTSTFTRVIGQGSFDVRGTSTLAFDGSVGVGQAVRMTGAAATLVLDAPDTFDGRILRFAEGDTIELADIDSAVARMRWRGDDDGVGGMLVIRDSDDVLTLRFDDGAYQTDRFDLTAITGGATLSYDAPDVAVARSLSIMAHDLLL